MGSGQMPASSLAFQGVNGRFSFPSAPAVAEAFAGIARRWPQRAPGDADPLRATVRPAPGPKAGLYQLEAPALERGHPPLSAIGNGCALAIELTFAWLAERPDLLCLHCGAFEAAGRLILVTGTARTGKSTLIARLGAEADVTLYADDLLPIDPATRDGIALGVAPRLRMPLPETATPRFAEFIAAHAGPADRQYHYLAAPNLAAHGRRATVAMILHLRRGEQGPPELRAIAPDRARRSLVLRNLVRDQAPERILASLDRVLAGAVSAELAYDDLEDAVELIRTRLLGPAGAIAGGKLALAPERPLPPRPAHSGDIAGDRRLAQASGVALRRQGESLFLTQIAGNVIRHLNPVGGAVWTLLAEPCDAETIADVLHAAFPDIPRATIRADVGALMAAMLDEGLARDAS